MASSAIVPPGVPGAGGADEPSQDGPAARNRSCGASPARPKRRSAYLTRAENGWRFQIRLPTALISADSTGSRSQRTILRYPLGDRFLGDPARIGGRLALLCQAVFEAAARRHEEFRMIGQEHSTKEGDLVAQVMAACQAGLDKAVADPSSALQFAHGLGSALDTLRLVEAETGRGPTGNPVVIASADAMIRSALQGVLNHAPDPAKASAVFAATSPADLSPQAAAFRCERDPAAQPKCNEAPLFSQVANEYITSREAGSASKSDLQTLKLRLKTFLDIIGDKPVDQYFFRDRQTYVNRMQFWPSNTTKRQAKGDWNAAAIIAETNAGSSSPGTANSLESRWPKRR